MKQLRKSTFHTDKTCDEKLKREVARQMKEHGKYAPEINRSSVIREVIKANLD